MTAPIAHLETALGLSFQEPSLLRQAMIHYTYREVHGGKDNERLEFLGDRVLELVVAELLYGGFLELDEGQLSRLRVALVRRETLAHFARRYDLGAYLFLGDPGDVVGRRSNEKVLCATFEALLGAVYLDQGLSAVRRIVHPLCRAFLDDHLEEALRPGVRNRLQIWTQRTHQCTPQYEVVQARPGAHPPHYRVEIHLLGEAIASGEGRSKRAASRAAAAKALVLLGVEAGNPAKTIARKQ